MLKDPVPPRKIIWENFEQKRKLQPVQNPEGLFHRFINGDTKKSKSAPSGLSFRVIIVPGTESRQEYKARTGYLSDQKRSFLDPVKLAQALATYDEEVWTWERIRMKCMPGHKLKDVPLIVRQCGAPFVFREHEDDIKRRGTFAWYPFALLGYNHAKFKAHEAHERRRIASAHSIQALGRNQ